MTRRGKVDGEVSGEQKLFFVFSILAIPLGLGIIAGGIVLILLNFGNVATICASIVIFLGFCMVTIPIGTALIIFHLRLKCHGGGLMITKRYANLARPRAESFRSLDDRIDGNRASSGSRNPYYDDGQKRPTLLQTYHSIENTIPKEIAAGIKASAINKRTDTTSNTAEDKDAGSQAKRKRKAPVLPQNTAVAVHKTTTDHKEKTRLGKPVPVPIAPIGIYNRSFVDIDGTPSDTGSSNTMREIGMTVSIENRNKEVYSISADRSPKADSSTKNASETPPRNVSTLYPAATPSPKPGTFEEAGTRM